MYISKQHQQLQEQNLKQIEARVTKEPFLERAAKTSLFTIVKLLKVLAFKYGFKYPSFLIALKLLNDIKNDIQIVDERNLLIDELNEWQTSGYEISYLERVVHTMSVKELQKEFNAYRTIIERIEQLRQKYLSLRKGRLLNKIKNIKKKLKQNSYRLHQLKQDLTKLEYVY